MRRGFIIWGAFLLAIAAPLPGCRKGEHDPLISLASRKARMENNWRLSEANVRLRYIVKGKTYDQEIDFAGGQFHFSETDSVTGALTNRGTGSMSVSMTLGKDGTMEIVEGISGDSFSGTGTWDFHGGAGDEKRKANVYMRLDKVTKSDSYRSLIFTNGQTEVNYHVRELRSKRLALTANKATYLNADGDAYLVQAEYLFTE